MGSYWGRWGGRGSIESKSELRVSQACVAAGAQSQPGQHRKRACSLSSASLSGKHRIRSKVQRDMEEEGGERVLQIAPFVGQAFPQPKLLIKINMHSRNNKVGKKINKYIFF